MRYLQRSVFNPVNINSKVLSILTLLFFLSALIFGAYVSSIDKGQVDIERFTISQALAYGEKGIMITFFFLALVTTLLLNYVRGGEKYLLYLRYFLISVSYILIITIIYVTTDINKSLHFKFAGTIFLFQLLVVLIISGLFNQYLDPDCDLLIAIDYNIILIFCSFILLIIFGIFEEDDTNEFDNIVFATNENITVFLNLLPILYLGFV